MSTLPEDLLEYLRNNRLGQSQRKILRQLAHDTKRSHESAENYAGCYVRRKLRIRRALDQPMV